MEHTDVSQGQLQLPQKRINVLFAYFGCHLYPVPILHSFILFLPFTCVFLLEVSNSVHFVLWYFRLPLATSKRQCAFLL